MYSGVLHLYAAASLLPSSISQEWKFFPSVEQGSKLSINYYHNDLSGSNITSVCVNQIHQSVYLDKKYFLLWTVCMGQHPRSLSPLLQKMILLSPFSFCLDVRWGLVIITVHYYVKWLSQYTLVMIVQVEKKKKGKEQRPRLLNASLIFVLTQVLAIGNTQKRKWNPAQWNVSYRLLTGL